MLIMTSHAWCFSNVIKRRGAHLTLQGQLTSNSGDWIGACVYIGLACIIRLGGQGAKARQFAYPTVAVAEKTRSMTALIIIQCDWLYGTAQSLASHSEAGRPVKLSTLHLACGWFCIAFGTVTTWNGCFSCWFCSHIWMCWTWLELVRSLQDSLQVVLCGGIRVFMASLTSILKWECATPLPTWQWSQLQQSPSKWMNMRILIW